MRNRRTADLALLVCAAAVALTTLWPLPIPGEDIVGLCLLCGAQGTADATLNVMLFVPLGVALGVAGRSRMRVSVLVAMALSGGVEAAQYAIPGRHPSPGDVLFNTLGAALGLALVVQAARWVYPTARTRARLVVGSALAAVAVFAATGLLLAPSLPRSTYYGQWTPRLGHLEWYRGRVLHAGIDSVALPSGRLGDSRVVQRLLEDGARIQITALAGPPTAGLGSLFSIYDDAHREILLIGPDGDDLVVRIRRRAARLRLDNPGYRIEGLLAGAAPGDTLSLALEGRGRHTCLSHSGNVACGFGFTVAGGWALLLGDVRAGPVRRLLNGGWMLVLLLPFGFWARPSRGAVLGGTLLVVGLVAIPPAIGLLPTPPTAWLAALAGVCCGIGLRPRGSLRKT